MIAREQIGAWVAQWGSQSSVPLALDGRGEAAFRLEDMHFQVSLNGPGDALLAACILVDQDIGSQASAMQALLAFAHLGGESNRCGVSLASTGRPVMWLWLNTAALDAAQVSNALTGFVATARKGREVVRAALVAAPRPADGAPVDLAFAQRV